MTTGSLPSPKNRQSLTQSSSGGSAMKHKTRGLQMVTVAAAITVDTPLSWTCVAGMIPPDAKHTTLQGLQVKLSAFRRVCGSRRIGRSTTLCTSYAPCPPTNKHMRASMAAASIGTQLSRRPCRNRTTDIALPSLSTPLLPPLLPPSFLPPPLLGNHGLNALRLPLCHQTTKQRSSSAIAPKDAPSAWTQGTVSTDAPSPKNTSIRDAPPFTTSAFTSLTASQSRMMAQIVGCGMALMLG